MDYWGRGSQWLRRRTHLLQKPTPWAGVGPRVHPQHRIVQEPPAGRPHAEAAGPFLPEPAPE